MKTKIADRRYKEAPDNIPPEIAFSLAYIHTKACIYLKEGPKKYRKEDYFHMPKSRSKKTLALIKSGMKQIAEWKGWNQENPLTKIGIKGFYSLMATFHFQLVSQKTIPIKNADDDKIYRILDEMTMKHVINNETIVLYNLVEEKRISPKEFSKIFRTNNNVVNQES